MDSFSFKSFEPCFLKATYPIEIGGRSIEKGENVAIFDSIQIAGLDEIKKFVSANGGYDNRPHVFWETTKEINLNFTQGIFSREQFALMSNSKLFELSDKEDVLISKIEAKETDENGQFELGEEPVDLFVYDEAGKKISYKIENKKISVEKPLTNVTAQYTYNYSNNVRLVKIGQRLFNGFLELEAHTRIKDDKTGKVTTGIIKIPKLKIITNLSMRLGKQATPTVGSFSGVGIPVGSRGSSYVCETYFLSNDIEADF